jgi:hypothetical protein
VPCIGLISLKRGKVGCLRIVLTCAQALRQCTPWTGTDDAQANAYRSGEKPKDFEFLRRAFFCGRIRHGAFKVKHKTSRNQFMIVRLYQAADRWGLARGFLVFRYVAGAFDGGLQPPLD